MLIGGNMQNREIQIKKQFEINASVETIFPLICPFGEYKWIPGWKFELVHCPNKRVEQGTIFREVTSPTILMGSPFGKTTWTAVLHDPKNYNIHFKLENRGSETLYKINMSDNGKGGALIKIDVKYQALNKLGDRVIANNGREKIVFMYDFIFQMLIHYCENGKMITLSQLRRRVSPPESLTFVDKIYLMIAQVRQSRLRKVK
jgi:hypothetical protein